MKQSIPEVITLQNTQSKLLAVACALAIKSPNLELRGLTQYPWTCSLV